MDRPLLPWGCQDNYPRKFRVRRDKVVLIPEKWRGQEPQWPGTLESRQSKKVNKKYLRRKEKLAIRKETKELINEQ